MPHLPVDHLACPGALRIVHPLGPEHLRGVQEGRERGPQLVRQHREEGVLPAVRLRERFGAPPQLLLDPAPLDRVPKGAAQPVPVHPALYQVVLGPLLERPLGLPLVVESGEDHDGNRLRGGMRPAEGL